jgi:hypothetical protein
MNRLQHPAVNDQIEEKLKLQRKQLNLVKLLHRIRYCQSALSALTSTDRITQGPVSRSRSEEDGAKETRTVDIKET